MLDDPGRGSGITHGVVKEEKSVGLDIGTRSHCTHQRQLTFDLRSSLDAALETGLHALHVAEAGNRGW